MPTRASRPYDPFSSLQTRRVAEAFSVSHTRIHRASLDADSPRTRSRSLPRPRARFLKTNTRESTPRVPSPPLTAALRPRSRDPSHPIPSHPIPRSLSSHASRRLDRDAPHAKLLLPARRRRRPARHRPPSSRRAHRRHRSARVPAPHHAAARRPRHRHHRARASPPPSNGDASPSRIARQTLNPTPVTVLCVRRVHASITWGCACLTTDETPGKRRAKRRARRRNDAARESATRGRSIDARRTREGVEANAREVRAADSRAFGFVRVRLRRVVERDSRENCERCAGRDDGDGAFAVV